MIQRFPGWLVSLVVILAVVGSLGWWAYQVTQSAPLATPATSISTVSPLSSPVIDALKQRTVNGGVPLSSSAPYDRADPFVKP